jgi:hypothetical protein
MSIDYEPARDRYRVRWRENGKQRSRRSRTLRGGRGVRGVDLRRRRRTRAPPATGPSGGGVYPYGTSEGTRWRFVFRQSDGGLTTRRGFTSRTAATTAFSLRSCASRGARRVGNPRCRARESRSFFVDIQLHHAFVVRPPRRLDREAHDGLPESSHAPANRCCTASASRAEAKSRDAKAHGRLIRFGPC